MLKSIRFLLILFLLIIAQTSVNSEIKKINEQLKSIENLFETGVLDEKSYDAAKQKLEKQKEQIQLQNTKKNSEQTSKTLEKQIEVLDKLFKDGVLSEEDYLKTKELILEKEAKGENIDLAEIKTKKLNYTLDIPKVHSKRSWEKSKMFYEGYEIYPYRPGGIKVLRTSDQKTLIRITDNFKVKFQNGGENIIEVKKTVYNPRDSKKVVILTNVKNKKPVWDKEAHKLELSIEGIKILTWQGRYVKKHRAFFYQVLTPRNEPFHFYIKLIARNAIALNMEFFNAKIDKAIRKAKKRLSAEFNVTETEIEKIIEQKIGDEVDSQIEKSMEEAINASVMEAIQESIGQELSALLVNAIEEATGEAIDDALESELASAIDAEIAAAVAQGIDEAAVTAGWEAYFEVLAAGGSDAEASAAAYEACGAACDNY